MNDFLMPNMTAKQIFKKVLGNSKNFMTPKIVGYYKIKDGSWEKIRKELDKCILLCFNCHMEREGKYEKSKQKNQFIPASVRIGRRRIRAD